MRPIEQIALKVVDRDRAITAIGDVLPITGAGEPMKWIRDRVSAVHVYLNSNYTKEAVGSGFSVALAFNYELMPLKELELIQLLTGFTVQLPSDENFNGGLSHLGYHIKDGDSLFNELLWWNAGGYRVAQVSVTTDHTGTTKRYMYAFVDTRAEVGVFTKVIARIQHPRDINDLVEEFSRVNFRVRAR
jgi:hypothetical protein